MVEYKDKSLNTIKEDIKKEFKKIEDSKKWFYRDDQEIYEAWKNVVDRYIYQLSNAEWMWVNNEKRWVKNGNAELITSENKYKNEALKYFRQAKANFIGRYNEVLKEKKTIFGMYITSRAENEEQIKQVAESINKAEEETLRTIREHCNPKQELDNAVNNNNVARDRQWNIKLNQWEIVQQDPLFNKSDDWTLTFTKKANPLKIHQVLDNLFKDKDVVYTIDYSNCKNSSIKRNMERIINWHTCLIKYDKKSQTYHLTGENWNILSNRALIWEWVSVKKVTDVNQLSNDWSKGNEWLNGSESTNNGNESALNTPDKTPDSYKFNANDYKYYVQFHEKYNKNICSSYAYWVVSDILAKAWYLFNAPDVNAWDIADSSYIKPKFNIDKIDDNSPQQQIIDAPAGTILTVRFNWTNARESWVSHAMVSLWNWVYTDLFGSRIRTIDFKSQTKFSWKTFNFRWANYTLTEDARLISPDLKKFDSWSSKTVEWSNITPDNFADQICESTWLNKSYVRSLIAKQNNIQLNDFWKVADKLSISIIEKEIKDMNLENEAWSNKVAEDFLESLKSHKSDIMKHYPKLSNYEYDEIAKRAVWILYQESNAGRYFKDNSLKPSRGIRKEKIYPFVNKIVVAANEISSYWSDNQQTKVDSNYSISSELNLSRWYTQIKFNELFKEEDKDFLKSFGINWDNDLADAGKCWIATMIWLIKKYYDYVVPMKSDPFRINDTNITQVTYRDGHVEEFARERVIRNHRRTDQEFDDAKNALCNKHGPIQSERETLRSWVTNPDDFFDFLYYARNQPSQIKYWTATPKVEWTYAYKANEHVERHLA